MKNHPLKVYIDRLKNEEVEQIEEKIEPDFLELAEEEFSFASPIVVNGQAYLTKDHLIVDLNIKAAAYLPCSMCNEKVEYSVEIDHFTHTMELSEIKGSIYDFSLEIRHALLLKIPQFIECNEGRCPQRKELSIYLKKSSETHPFSSL